jgi:hypothetical protein
MAIAILEKTTIITYNKGRRGREAFSIHPWMASYKEENLGRN